ncbi:MAG: hypothetical protein ABIL01_20275 [Pseudomonadota bacterium]
MKKAQHERSGRREFSGYPKRATAHEIKGRAISSEALLVAAILLSAALLLVTFLAPAAKRVSVPDEGNGSFSKHAATAAWGADRPPALGSFYRGPA